MRDKDSNGLCFNYADSVKCIEINDSSIQLQIVDNSGCVFYMELSLYNDSIIKIRAHKVKNYVLEHDFVTLKDYVMLKEFVEETDDTVTIKNSKIMVVINKNPYSFKVCNLNGKVIIKENLNDVNPVGKGEDRIPPLGYSFDNKGTCKTMNICFTLSPYENIYGLGEKFTEFSKRGQKIKMCNWDALGVRNEKSYKNVPFYVSTEGYGLLVNSNRMTEFNIGSKSTSSININVPGDFMEYYIIIGNNLKEIISQFMVITGPAVMPPKWSFGLWFSTGFKGASQQTIEADSKHFRKDNVPCDVIHFDCYWLRDNMWCDFIWDSKMYPKYKQLIQSLKSQGFKVCLWINPYVTVVTDMYKEGKNKGYFVKNSKGEPYLSDLWHGLLPICAILDFTNHEAALWYRSKLIPLLNDGIDVFKTDFGENIPFDGVFFNGKTGEEMRNIYSTLYNNVVYNTVKEAKGNEAMVWARSGFIGMQRTPVVWMGDPYSSFEGMASVIRGGLSLSMSGVPFWSHDMGGFYGNVSPDVFVRWSQFGLLCSHSRLHGTTTRQPWAYGDREYKIITDFIRLRYKLMPYIIKTAQNCIEQSLPFVRPMILEHPDDPACIGIWDQYYMGEDIIVAPVFAGDDAMRKVYIPEGEWVDYFSGLVYKGTRYVTYSCKLETIPLLFRKGANIPMDEIPQQHL